MIRILVAATGLAVLWLLMSGIYTKPLILIFGALSVIITMIIVIRMEKAGEHHLDFNLRLIPLISYIVWLFVQIAKSNWLVTKVVLSGKPPSKRKLFEVPVTCKGELAQVMFATSITLTPGTVTVETEGDKFFVHALQFEDDTLDDLSEMDRRVAAVEEKRKGNPA